MKASRKIGVNRRRINPNDSRVTRKPTETVVKKSNKKNEEPLREVVKPSLGMFFNYNSNLAPPYHVIVDTNFINFSIQHKLDILQEMMNCLLGKCIPYVTDCVIGELEKMGHRFRLALKLARDPRFKRLKCLHSGTYADDCLVQRVIEHKCFIVATNDKDLKRRIRKIPGVPIMFVTNHKYAIERMPDALSNVPLGKGPSN